MIAFILFVIAVIESNTLEVEVVTENRGADQYFATKHSIHWDRLTSYLLEFPARVLDRLSLIKNKWRRL